jgi:AcrR family transcriptional regulator
VIDVARQRFLRDGYAATTVPAIAAEAGVAAKTVAAQFGNKAGLMKAVFDAALVGDAKPGGLEERDHIAAIHQEASAVRKLEMFAAALTAMLPRTAPIQLLLRQAGTDAELAQVWATIKAGRLAGMTNVAQNLEAGGHLRRGLTADAARDVLWTYSSPELFDLLVGERGWTLPRYTEFLVDALKAALLAPRANRRR